ncbi:hypothetical protein SGPA1_40747 [Streptomyces misionensis JCM 4497]
MAGGGRRPGPVRGGRRRTGPLAPSGPPGGGRPAARPGRWPPAHPGGPPGARLRAAPGGPARAVPAGGHRDLVVRRVRHPAVRAARFQPAGVRPRAGRRPRPVRPLPGTARRGPLPGAHGRRRVLDAGAARQRPVRLPVRRGGRRRSADGPGAVAVAGRPAVPAADRAGPLDRTAGAQPRDPDGRRDQGRRGGRRPGRPDPAGLHRPALGPPYHGRRRRRHVRCLRVGRRGGRDPPGRPGAGRRRERTPRSGGTGGAGLRGAHPGGTAPGPLVAGERGPAGGTAGAVRGAGGPAVAARRIRGRASGHRPGDPRREGERPGVRTPCGDVLPAAAGQAAVAPRPGPVHPARRPRRSAGPAARRAGDGGDRRAGARRDRQGARRIRAAGAGGPDRPGVPRGDGERRGVGGVHAAGEPVHPAAGGADRGGVAAGRLGPAAAAADPVLHPALDGRAGQCRDGDQRDAPDAGGRRPGGRAVRDGRRDEPRAAAVVQRADGARGDRHAGRDRGRVPGARAVAGALAAAAGGARQPAEQPGVPDPARAAQAAGGGRRELRVRRLGAGVRARPGTPAEGGADQEPHHGARRGVSAGVLAADVHAAGGPGEGHTVGGRLPHLQHLGDDGAHLGHPADRLAGVRGGGAAAVRGDPAGAGRRPGGPGDEHPAGPALGRAGGPPAVVPLHRRRPAGPGRRLLRGAAGRVRRHRRPERLRQVHPAAAADRLRPAGLRQRPVRRPGPRGTGPVGGAPPVRGGAPARPAVHRLPAGRHLRDRAVHPRGGDGGGRDGGARGGHQADADGPAHHRLRQRVGLRRPAPAPDDRPGPDPPSPHPLLRRGDQRPRQRHPAHRHRQHPQAERHPDRDRPPPVHGAGRGPGTGDGGRQGGPAGQSRGAAGGHDGAPARTGAAAAGVGTAPPTPRPRRGGPASSGARRTSGRRGHRRR